MHLTDYFIQSGRAFKLYTLLHFVFPAKQMHDLDVASSMIHWMSSRNTKKQNIPQKMETPLYFKTKWKSCWNKAPLAANEDAPFVCE